MPSPSRRQVVAGAVSATALALTGCSAGEVEVRRGTLRSRHVPGRDLPWVLAMPRDRSVLRAPVVVLHGKGGHGEQALDLLHLDDHVAATGLAVAAVDGGNGYWHRRDDGTDSGAMVTDDFLPLVAQEYGATDRVAFLGWSMGGYGSLLLASGLGPERVAAVAPMSAALWTSPGASAPGAFDDREDFERHDVFAADRRRVLERIPVRMDCGREDPFAAANRAFGQALPSARVAIDDGGHTGDYWRDHGGPQLRWIRSVLDGGASA